MKGDRYSDVNLLAISGTLISALGGGGDRGQSVPSSDAEDFGRGVQFVPAEVTWARREGKIVHFDTSCQTSKTCWFWQMPDGERIYYFDRGDFENIRDNHGGTCPTCGNTHIGGGSSKA